MIKSKINDISEDFEHPHMNTIVVAVELDSIQAQQ